MKISRLFPVCIIAIFGMSQGYCDQVTNDSEVNVYQKYAPVVAQLQKIIEADPSLKKMLGNMLASAPKGNPWQHKSVSDVYVFLNRLLEEPLLPGIPERDFFELRNSKAGMIFLNHPAIMSWFNDFFHQIYIVMSRPASKKLISKWEETPGFHLNMKEFIIPKGGFENFNAFFGRRLKPGTRPINSPKDNSVVVSPNDGDTSLMVSQIENKQLIQVKGDRLDIRDIFNDNPIAQKFIGGPVIMQYLRETSYHHFHAPVSGKVVYSDIFAGNRTFENNWKKSIFNHNRAVYIFHNPCVGYVGMVPVGFWIVGSINLFKKTGDYVTKGEETGQFKLGSSILLFFEPGRVVIDHNKKQAIPIQVGQKLAHSQLACPPDKKVKEYQKPVSTASVH